MKNLLLLLIPILFLACSSGDDAGEPIVLTKMELVPIDKELAVGDKYQMKVNFTPSNVGNPQCEWKSSDTNVATVSQKGVVEVKGYGVSTITATYGGLTTSIYIAIQNPDFNPVVGTWRSTHDIEVDGVLSNEHHVFTKHFEHTAFFVKKSEQADTTWYRPYNYALSTEIINVGFGIYSKNVLLMEYRLSDDNLYLYKFNYPNYYWEEFLPHNEAEGV